MSRSVTNTLVWGALLLLHLTALPVLAGYDLGPELLVEAMGELVDVPAYCVPSFADWNDDDLPDLIIGEGGGIFLGKVRVYLNSGTPQNPQFTTEEIYARTATEDLWHYGSG